jgi:hypothetical protein
LPLPVIQFSYTSDIYSLCNVLSEKKREIFESFSFHYGVSQAALDVFTEEPPPSDSKLVQHEDVTVTPHLGVSTTESQVCWSFPIKLISTT